MSATVFELPVLYQHNKNENVRIMLETLGKLETLSNSIFTKIEKQIEEKKGYLSSIQKRIERSKGLVNTLKSRTDATSVFSPSHLDHVVVPTKPLFLSSEKDRTPVMKIKTQPEHFRLSKYSNPLMYQQEKKKLEQLSKKRRKKRRKGEDDNEEDRKYYSDIGMGRFPENLSCVSSLLVFNSNSNCYAEYNTTFDPLLGEVRDLEAEEVETGIEDPAPPSMTGEVNIFEYENIGIGFKPKPRELKGFEEVDLGLKNVAKTSWAHDFDFETSLLPSSHIPDLPDVEKGDEDPDAVPTINPDEDDDDDEMDDDVPPPPPPGMDDDSDYTDDEDGPPPPPPADGMDDGNMGLGGDAPPPPDIGGMADMDSPAQGAPSAELASNPNLPQVSDARGDLMASIRAFKLKKLKTVDIKVGKKKVAAKKNVPVGNSLLSQLAGALAMRRKAMQGKKESSDETGGDSGGFGDDGGIAMPKRENEDDGGGDKPEKPPAEDDWSDDDGDGDEWGDDD